MLMEYAFIDPLQLAVRRTITRSSHPLSSRVSFGSEENVEEIAASIKSLLESGKAPLLWMSHILEPGRVSRLTGIPGITKAACIVGENTLTDAMQTTWQSLDVIPLFFYDVNGILRPGNPPAKDANWNDLVGQSIHELRASWVTGALSSLLKGHWRCAPDGKPMELPSKRLVGRWLDMKSVLAKPDNAFFIAYELGFVLSNGYQDELQEIDAFACSNNTGLILASHLSLIFAKELLIIDRAGPLPKLPTRASPGIRGLNVCLVEEVIATGREVDLASLFIQMSGATLAKILAVCKIGPPRPTVAKLVPIKVLCHLPDTTVVEVKTQLSSDACMKGVSNHAG